MLLTAKLEQFAQLIVSLSSGHLFSAFTIGGGTVRKATEAHNKEAATQHRQTQREKAEPKFPRPHHI